MINQALMILALGDSLALGTGSAMNIPTIAKVGADACWINQHVPPTHAHTIVLSAGVNGGEQCLSTLRKRIHADHVIWIKPINGASKKVMALAYAYNDQVITYTPGSDHLHPNSYQSLAKKVRSKLR